MTDSTKSCATFLVRFRTNKEQTQIRSHAFVLFACQVAELRALNGELTQAARSRADEAARAQV